MPTISTWLREATKVLKQHDVASARLDAEIILAHTLRKNRTWLHAHSDDNIEPRLRDIADARIDLRSDRVPIAYIIGHKEFYGRRFHVSPRVLVPRPESEELITQLKRIVPLLLGLAPTQKHLVDVGTGSGVLGITAKLELPELDVLLTDNDRAALSVAKRNAAKLQANVTLLESDLLQKIYRTVDIIIANLPYVDQAWELAPELTYEPESALFADDNGYALIARLITQAVDRLSSGGYLLLEADPRQLTHIALLARHHGLHTQATGRFSLTLQKR